MSQVALLLFNLRVEVSVSSFGVWLLDVAAWTGCATMRPFSITVVPMSTLVSEINCISFLSVRLSHFRSLQMISIYLQTSDNPSR